MPMSDAERSRKYRDRKRGGPPPVLEPHGTHAAYRRHERAGETPVGDYCSKCREAENEYQNQLYQQRKENEQ